MRCGDKERYLSSPGEVWELPGTSPKMNFSLEMAFLWILSSIFVPALARKMLNFRLKRWRCPVVYCLILDEIWFTAITPSLGSILLHCMQAIRWLKFLNKWQNRPMGTIYALASPYLTPDPHFPQGNGGARTDFDERRETVCNSTTEDHWKQDEMMRYPGHFQKTYFLAASRYNQ